MNPTLSDRLTQAYAIVEDVLEGSPDRCSVVDQAVINETGTSGTKLSPVTLASDLAVIYEKRTAQSEGPLAHVTHDLFIKATAVTRVITPKQKVVVAAREDIPQIVFEKPVLLEETLGPLVHLGARKYMPTFGD